MTTEIVQPRAAAQAESAVKIPDADMHGRNGQNGTGAISVLQPQTNLPTFSLEAGWREVYDPETGEYYQTPLTLRDILFPTEDDIGAVFMAQSPPHAVWVGRIKHMVEAYREASEWLFLDDVLIHWGILGVPPKAPDITAIPGGKKPPKGEKSYRVGRDGPLPTFVVEVTSEETRKVDLEAKTIFYAAVGIQEFLLIDTLPEEGDSWQLTGYRLGDSPYYETITPDAKGELTFETIGLRFVAVGYADIAVYDAITGERLLTPKELKDRGGEEAAARAEAEEQAKLEAAARAEAEEQAKLEVAARTEVEQENQELKAALKELRRQIKAQGS